VDQTQADIERELAETRVRLAETLDEIAERLDVRRKVRGAVLSPKAVAAAVALVGTVVAWQVWRRT
jgi:hypothetical protein